MSVHRFPEGEKKSFKGRKIKKNCVVGLTRSVKEVNSINSKRKRSSQLHCQVTFLSPNLTPENISRITTFTNYFHFLSSILPFPQELLILSPCWTPSSSPTYVFPHFIIPMFPKLKAPRSSSSHTVNLSPQYIFIYAREIRAHYSPLLTHNKTKLKPGSCNVPPTRFRRLLSRHIAILSLFLHLNVMYGVNLGFGGTQRRSGRDVCVNPRYCGLTCLHVLLCRRVFK